MCGLLPLIASLNQVLWVMSGAYFGLQSRTTACDRTDKQPVEELSYQGHNRTLSGEVLSTEKVADESVDNVQFRVMKHVVFSTQFVLKEKRQ